MPDAASVVVRDAEWRARTRRRGRRRHAVSVFGWCLCGVALALLCTAMVWIIGMVAVAGLGALRWSTLTQVTQGTGGGLLNAIEGTAVIAVGTLLLAVPFGVTAGIYAAEFRWTRWAVVIRFLSDVLAGVPSIVLGYFG